MFFILSASECVLTPSRARCIPMQAQTTIKSIFSSNLILRASHTAIQPHVISENGFTVNQTESEKSRVIKWEIRDSNAFQSYASLYRTA